MLRRGPRWQVVASPGPTRPRELLQPAVETFSVSAGPLPSSGRDHKPLKMWLSRGKRGDWKQVLLISTGTRHDSDRVGPLRSTQSQGLCVGGTACREAGPARLA